MDASTAHRRRFSAETIVDGRPVRDSAVARLRGRVRALRVSAREREEAEVERRLRSGPAVTRANTVAVASPGGDGAVVVPYDERLKLMLESGAYSLAALPRLVRLPIKRLGRALPSGSCSAQRAWGPDPLSTARTEHDKDAGSGQG